MFTPSAPNSFGCAFVSMFPPATLPTAQAEPVRHMLFGSAPAVQSTIKQLYKLGYAESNDWSQLMPTGRSDEVMAILTRRVKTP